MKKVVHLMAALSISWFAYTGMARAQVTRPAPQAAPAPAAASSQHVPGQAELDARFIKAMTGATLVGSFTEGAGGDVGSDRYNIVSVKRTEGDNWEIVARLRFKSFDVNVPLKLPVKWAGDTAVITVDDVKVPGIGTYTARVMILGDQYAGVWHGATHGGELWGKIEHEAASPATRPGK